MLVGVALVVRAARLFQAVPTAVFGLGLYRNPLIGLAACCAALVWSAFLMGRSWPAGRVTLRLMLGDAAVAVLVLAALASVTPPRLLPTSFFWALPYAQSVAMVLAFAGLGKAWRLLTGIAALASVVLSYSLAIDLGANARALPAASGNAVGIVAYFAVTMAVVIGVRRFARGLDQAHQRSQERAAELDAQSAQLEELLRLHNDAVQVLERVGASDEPRSPSLRAHARRARDYLRSAMERSGGHTSCVSEALADAVELFDEPGFRVVLDCPPRLPQLGATACSAVRDAVTEALTNARKHAGTDEVWIRVSPVERGLELCVVDRGIGFDPAAVRPGFGLASSIRERLERVGGRMELEASPRSGTTVRMWLPN